MKDEFRFRSGAGVWVGFLTIVIDAELGQSRLDEDVLAIDVT
jgi:hypothetical protein